MVTGRGLPHGSITTRLILWLSIILHCSITAVSWQAWAEERISGCRYPVFLLVKIPILIQRTSDLSCPDHVFFLFATVDYKTNVQEKETTYHPILVA